MTYILLSHYYLPSVVGLFRPFAAKCTDMFTAGHSLCLSSSQNGGWKWLQSHTRVRKAAETGNNSLLVHHYKPALSRSHVTHCPFKLFNSYLKGCSSELALAFHKFWGLEWKRNKSSTWKQQSRSYSCLHIPWSRVALCGPPCLLNASIFQTHYAWCDSANHCTTVTSQVQLM